MNFSCTRILPQILISSSRGEVYKKILRLCHGKTISIQTMFVSCCVVLHRDSLRYQTWLSILFPLWTLSSLLFMVDLVKMGAFRFFAQVYFLLELLMLQQIWLILLQELLESHNIPFVGTGSSECRRAFDKVNNKILISRYSSAAWVV